MNGRDLRRPPCQAREARTGSATPDRPGHQDRATAFEVAGGVAAKRARASDTIVLFNAEPESQAFMDQGAKRSFGDVLHIAGEASANELSAATKGVFWWEYDGLPVGTGRGQEPTISQLFDVLDRHPGIRESLAYVGKNPFVTQSFAAIHHYLFSMVDGDSADEFMRLFATGENLSKGNPVHTLRERLLRERAKSTTQLHTKVRSLFMHRAWQAWQDGINLAKLDFRSKDLRPDRFPSIVVERDE